MPGNYRRKGYKKRNVFSRTPRARGKGSATRRTENNREGNVKLTVGRKLVWVFNNYDSEIVLRPGETLILVIIDEYENSLGLNLRTKIADPNKDAEDIKFSREDWA